MIYISINIVPAIKIAIPEIMDLKRGKLLKADKSDAVGTDAAARLNDRFG
jgi:hypothetical protein